MTASQAEIGVALVCEADLRAARLSLQSVLRQTMAPVSTTVLLGDSQALRRSGNALVALPASVERIDVRAGFSIRGAALEAARARLSDDGVVLLMREGLVLDPALFGDLAARFGSDPELAAGLLSYGRGGSNINEMPRERLATENPWELVEATSGYEQAAVVLQARYLRPCLLAVRAGLARSLQFEEFSSLGDWYAYKRLLAQVGAPARVFEEASPQIGYVGNQPDRRDPFDQGQEAARALYRIAAGYPEFASDVRADFRTLARSQLRGLFDPARAHTARSFLRGMLAQKWAQRALRRRLDRDIAELS
jgi:hypothetical protein